MQAAVLKLLDDRDWSVQKQLAATLGELPAESRVAALASLLERHGDDPVAMDAALSGLHGQEAAVLERILQATADTPQPGSSDAATSRSFSATLQRRRRCTDVITSIAALLM